MPELIKKNFQLSGQVFVDMFLKLWAGICSLLWGLGVLHQHNFNS